MLGGQGGATTSDNLYILIEKDKQTKMNKDKGNLFTALEHLFSHFQNKTAQVSWFLLNGYCLELINQTKLNCTEPNFVLMEE